MLGKQLDILSQAARQGIEDVRKSVASLKPDALRRKSVIQAIREMIDTTERMTRTEISFDDEVPPMLLDEDEEMEMHEEQEVDAGPVMTSETAEPEEEAPAPRKKLRLPCLKICPMTTSSRSTCRRSFPRW